jgi:hypothetical protein
VIAASDNAAKIASLVAQVVELRRLLTESLGWMEGVEPKPASAFIAAIRAALDTEAHRADPKGESP